MPLSFTVPPPVLIKPKAVDLRDFSGEDISLRTGDLTVSSGGDWATVSDVYAARQSVEREASAAPGEMPRRPQWGMGLKAELMRGLSPDSRDRQISTVRRRLQANPRISTVQKIEVQNRTDLTSNGNVTVVVVEAVAAGKPISLSTTLKPRIR